jgi:hypothetical protein
MPPTTPHAAADLPRFSLVGEDPWQRLQRFFRLIPANGLGLGRRIAALVLVTWGVLMALAILQDAPLAAGAGEPLLRHFGVHARCLWAIPLLIIAEAMVDPRLQQVLSHFVRSGLVHGDSLAAFHRVVRSAERWSSSWLAFALVVVLATFGPIYGVMQPHSDELSWAVHPDGAVNANLALGWYLFVVRPIFAVLLMRWLWRLLVASVLLRRVARLDLDLVPTHADRAAGLGFLEELPIAFIPVVLAISGVIAARLGHDVLYHELRVANLRMPLAAFAVLVLMAFLAPLLAFAPRLLALKRSAIFAYSDLVGRHGRLVRRRWVDGEDVGASELLAADEIGPVADTLPLYGAVTSLRPVPFGRRPIAALLLAAALPFLPVLAIEIPLREALAKLASALL